MKKTALLLTLALLLSLCGCAPGWGQQTDEKPVIYLYPEQVEPECAEKPVVYLQPEQATQVTVELDFAGTLTCTYPEYRDGWTVWAQPDGTLTDENGREYGYLFWEGVSDTKWDMSEGFVVAGADTCSFLETTLAELGLNDREAGDFITYWLPRMQENAYNLITFQQEAYTETAKLTVTPEPDSILRVFMVFQPLDEPVPVDEPQLPEFQRQGFTVVEWGGTELSE